MAPASTIQEISEALYLSESYIYKTIPIFNNEISKYKLSIIATSKSYFEIVGDEAHIRSFMFMFFFNSYLDIEWPEEFALGKGTIHSYNDIFGETYNEMSDIQKRRFQFIFAITDNRLRKGKSISILENDMFDILLVFQHVNDLSIGLNFFKF